MENKITKKQPGRPRKFNEEEVLQRAAEAFLDDGFEASSYENIAAAMGLSKPSLYNTFGDKTALFQRVVAEYSLQAHAQIVANFSEAETLKKAIQNLLTAGAHFYSRSDGPSVGCLLVGTALPASSQYDEVRNILINFTDSLELSIQTTIAERYAEDAARIARKPEEIAMHVSSLLFALAVRARMGVSRKRLLETANELTNCISGL